MCIFCLRGLRGECDCAELGWCSVVTLRFQKLCIRTVASLVDNVFPNLWRFPIVEFPQTGWTTPMWGHKGFYFSEVSYWIVG